ncbi:MAG TPA: hypothetical protein VFB54_13435 [Burkholderiales bacterium]|nr:hypothetical protein [Burkholderiales bacterium]
MSTHRIVLVAALLLFGAAPARSAELIDCIKFSAAGSEAQLTNVCGDRLNVVYCVDNASSPRSCAKGLSDIVTLNAGAIEHLSTYASDGRGTVHWGVCLYPTAPVDWKPGATEVVCKKTCVMC